MRSWMLLSVPLALTTACAAPLEGPRGVAGTAESGTTAILAVDSAGDSFRIAPNADASFVLLLPTTRPVHLFQVKGEELQVVRFAEKTGGPAVASSLPAHEGTVQMGALSTSAEDPDTAEAEDSPLEQIDSDDDGEVDAEDEDDDNDGEDDDADSDDDGEDGPDAEDDLDTDDDGSPDLCDDDDDDDGIDDAEDEDDGDADDDGVEDGEDLDDDNDGDDDADDSDDDGDGTDDADEIEDESGDETEG